MLTPKSVQISLRKLRFHAFIGVGERERVIGNEFEVSLSVKIPFNPEMGADDLEATISYADLYEVVTDVMTRPRKLLERVAIEIAEIIKQRWADIESGEIEIIKIAPPIPGITGEAGVKLFF